MHPGTRAATSTSTTAAFGPDLVATDIAWPTPLLASNAVPFSFTVQNIGDTATPANTVLDALVTVDGVDVGWSDNLTAPLAPGGVGCKP